MGYADDCVRLQVCTLGDVVCHRWGVGSDDLLCMRRRARACAGLADKGRSWCGDMDQCRRYSLGSQCFWQQLDLGQSNLEAHLSRPQHERHRIHREDIQRIPFFGRLNVGYAGIGGGRLTDNDYLAADRGNPSSVTHSDINGNNMWYVNADAGARMLTFADHRGWLDAFVGFQYWSQQFQAFGVRQVTCTTAGATVNLGGGQVLCPATTQPNSVLAITNTTNWYTIRTGGQVAYQLARRFGVEFAAALHPVTILDNKDIHHLRSDLQQNPSFSMTGFGFGADADAGVKFMLVEKLVLNVGYRVWWNRIIDGTLKNHPVGSASQFFPLTQFESLRHGLTAGITYTF